MFYIGEASGLSLIGAARSAFPKEASGLLVRRSWRHAAILSVVPTPSAENTPLSFIIRDSEIDRVRADLQDADGELCGCFHSHVFGQARPSGRDISAQKAVGDLWLIYSVSQRRLGLFQWEGDGFARRRVRLFASLRPAGPNRVRTRL